MVLFQPYLRKAGAYTLPSFLGHRFRSRPLRMMASLAQLPPTALLLAAEMKVAALIAALFLPITYPLAVAAVGLIIAAIAIAGGMRAVTWSGSAEFIVAALGFAAPLIIASILLTNLPAPQLTYGESFAPLQKSEITAGLIPSQPQQLTTALPGATPRGKHQAFPAALRRDHQVRLPLAVPLSCARHRGAAEPAPAQRRHELDRRSAPGGRLGRAVRGAVRGDHPGARRLRPLAHVPGHRAISGRRSADLAWRA